MARTLTPSQTCCTASSSAALACVEFQCDRVGDGDKLRELSALGSGLAWLGSALVIIFISFDGFGSSPPLVVVAVVLVAAATPLCSCICMPFHGQVQRTRLNCRKQRVAKGEGGERRGMGQHRDCGKDVDRHFRNGAERRVKNLSRNILRLRLRPGLRGKRV